jgi:hypothetical protein
MVGRSDSDCSSGTSTADSFMYTCGIAVVGGLYQLEWESGAGNMASKYDERYVLRTLKLQLVISNRQAADLWDFSFTAELKSIVGT